MSRKRQEQDSLELFLDTICNMFGGFVFIMLFVVVSLRSTSEKAIEETIKEERASMAELETMEIELDELRAQWSQVSDLIATSKEFLANLTSGDVVDTRTETLEVLDELREASEELATETSRAAELQREKTALDVARAEAESELRAAEKAVRDAKADAEAAERAVAQNASPPQMRDRGGDKPDLGVVLKYGKLYVWQSDPESREYNSKDFVVVSEGAFAVRVEPRLDRGVDLTSPGAVTRLEKAFAPYPANRYVVSLVVSGDTYSEFAVVRDFLKDRLYQIRIFIGPTGTKVYDRGGSETKSQ